MPCHTLATLRDDPHLSAVALTQTVTHPIEGAVTAVRSSILIDDEVPQAISSAKPRGWDTVEILQEIGIAPVEIETLRSAGAIHDGRASYPSSPADPSRPHQT
jgi:crotonobetainyl-CoA:carnitine CoA-transferase CaiB-like acyl-CoA transferase